MPKGDKSTILIAAISAISAVVVAAITTYGTIAISAPAVKKAKQEIDSRQIRNLPVGTIVSSMLPPTKFAEAVGDLDRTPTEWALADGQKDITNSRYGQLTGNRTPPDLRGMFLRGMNEGRNDGMQDPQDGRKAGQPQADMLGQHHHIVGSRWETPGSQNYKFTEDKGSTKPDNYSTKDEGGAETRPRNVAVYFYIKIN